MKCYKCNTTLLSPDKDTCPNCGTDLKLYKKIIYTSNYYYNMGLEKARVKDLTGAAECLKRSLQLNKKNIDARNLLGLVYFETGEAALAIQEWMISKGFQYRNNRAEEYLKDLEQDTEAMKEIGQSIQKYNSALQNARRDGMELAAVQLKKVLAVNPRMIKAYELLALLYIGDKKYNQAQDVLERCLEVDRGNTKAQLYLKEIGGRTKAVLSSGEKRGMDDSVIMPAKYRSYGSYFSSVLCILLGVVIAAGLLHYFASPLLAQKYEVQNQENLQAYEQSMQDLSIQAAAQESTIADLQRDIADLQAQNEELSTNSGNSTSLQMTEYENLLKTSAAYFREDWITVYEMFPEIDSTKISDSNYQATYNALRTAYYSTLGQGLVDQGNKRLEQGLITDANECYVAATKINPQLPEAYYGVAVCYETIELNTSRVYYNRVISMFPSSEWAQRAQQRLNNL